MLLLRALAAPLGNAGCPHTAAFNEVGSNVTFCGLAVRTNLAGE
jgi:hypothetical protein